MTTTQAPDTFRDVIKATDRGGYLVRSASRRLLWWMVSTEDGKATCGCEFGQTITAVSQRACRHQRRVLAFVNDENARMARPVMAPNYAAFE